MEGTERVFGLPAGTGGRHSAATTLKWVEGGGTDKGARGTAEGRPGWANDTDGGKSQGRGGEGVSPVAH